MLLRGVLVGLFIILAATQVVRTAAVAAFAEDRTSRVAAVWPSHPDVLRSVAMAEVGAAAGRGQEPPGDALRRLRQLAYSEPLATEPYLVHGAIAQRRGDFARAQALLLKARARDPRSEAARFLLADLYLRSGRIVPGLAEMSVLGRMIPGAMDQVAPALAAYAANADAVPHLRSILLAYPELEPALLNELAQNPANAELIIAIAPPDRPGGDPPQWQEKLLNGMVEQGDYERAHGVWARLAGVQPASSRGLFNPGFTDSDAPPPFDWSLASNASGVAEPDGGGLQVLYFGRDDVALASQLMLLPAGHYRLEMKLSAGTGADTAIGWRVTCLPRKEVVLDLPLGGRPGGIVAGEFDVLPGCAAQRIELRGEGREFPRSADIRIHGLKLARIGG